MESIPILYPTSSSPNGRSLSGFTLLELSVVLFVMAVLLGVAIPSFSNLLESNLQKETQKLASIITDLRMQAVMKSESYKLVFDTKKSEYQIYTIDPIDQMTDLRNDQYNDPIKLTPPVELAAISTREETAEASKFGFKKLEFDKIFGQQYEFRIDSSGFIDLFAVKLSDKKNTITLLVKNIMGEIEIGNETPL